MHWAQAFAAGCEVHTATQMVGDGGGEIHLPCRVPLALRAPRGTYLPGETRGHWVDSANPRPHLCCNPARGPLSMQLPLLPTSCLGSLEEKNQTAEGTGCLVSTLFDVGTLPAFIKPSQAQSHRPPGGELAGARL